MLAERNSIEPVDPVEVALAWHDGDVRATILTLLEDCRFLREQVAISNRCISKGLTRGWVARLERGGTETAS